MQSEKALRSVALIPEVVRSFRATEPTGIDLSMGHQQFSKRSVQTFQQPCPEERQRLNSNVHSSLNANAMIRLVLNGR